MKARFRYLLLLVLIAALVWPQVAWAQEPLEGDEYVFGGTFTLEEDETLNGNLYIFGGVATLEEGSVVNGNVMLAGGTLRADGTINGDIAATGGQVDLGEAARVTGDVSVLAANLDRDPGARIDGDVDIGRAGPFRFDFPNAPQPPRPQVTFNPFNLFLQGMWFFFRSFLWAALAALVVLFLPRHARRTSDAIVTQPLLAGGVGLLTAVIAPLLLVFAAITLIGIPVSILGFLVLVVAWAFGMVALGTEAGRRIASALNQDWAPAVSAAIGTFVLVVVVNGIGLIDCVGWIAPAVAGMLALGGVVLTRFGTQPYPPAGPAAPYAVPPQAGPPVSPPPEPSAPVVYEEPLAGEDETQTQGGARVYPTE